MSREITGTATTVTGEDQNGPDGVAARGRRRPRAALVGSVAALGVLVAGLAVVVVHPGGPVSAGRSSSPSPSPPAATAGRAAPHGGTLVPDELPVNPDVVATITGAGAATDLDRVPVTIRLTNRGATPLVPTALGLLGLGTALVDQGDLRPIPVGASTDLPATLIADCTARLDPAVTVLVTVQQGRGAVLTVRARTAPADQVAAVLQPVCPPVEQVLAVAITGTRTNDDDSLTVRLVNHGRLSTTVVTLAGPDALPAGLALDPPAPVPLTPGQAVVETLRVSVPGCQVPDPRGAADALSLEARTSYGFTQVSGWPRLAVQRLIARQATACAARLG